LSYQANWKLFVMRVDYEPLDADYRSAYMVNSRLKAQRQ